MSKLIPISKEEFKSKSWKKATSNLYAAKDSYCLISAQEALEAGLKLPLAFVNDGNHYALVAVLGVTQEQNLYIGPRGNWYIDFKPRFYRCYPFAMAVNSENHEQLIFCFDEESGLLDDSADHEPFFLENGEFTTEIERIIKFLRQHYSDMQATNHYCSILNEFNLLKRLDVKFEIEGTTHKIDGLHTIDESSLQNLSDEEFCSLRKAGLLPLVYSQLLSLKNFASLIKIAKIRLPAMNRATPLEELFTSDDNGIINLDNI